MATCIITGASAGIGRAAAIEVSKLEEFDNIVLISRREDLLIQTKSMMRDSCNIETVVLDVGEIDKIPTVISGIYKNYGSIDCLLNIAGYTDPKFLFETTDDNLRKTFGVNVFAPYVLCRECAKYMKGNNGTSKIINIASTAGSTARPGWSVYAMSKAAIIEMSLTLTEELSSYGIKVYCLSPGRCATELRKKLAPEEDQSKIMQPETVGKEIARMASASEICLDGQNIVIRKKF
ncbi:MAG: SDR family oxidoreductase [Clostridia bacterium]|nr:SDR family oxidoreductase [Clostridia bacterium]